MYPSSILGASTRYFVGGLAMIIAVDFDGTICVSRYPKIIRLRFLARPVLRWAHKRHTIILWTCRNGAALEEALKWLDEHKVPYDYVNENPPEQIKLWGGDCRKVSADFYIDDKGVGWWSWIGVFFAVLRGRKYRVGA